MGDILRINSTAIREGPKSGFLAVVVVVCCIQADSYGNKKLIRKKTKSVFFFGTKNLVRVKLMATVLFQHGFDY